MPDAFQHRSMSFFLAATKKTLLISSGWLMAGYLIAKEFVICFKNDNKLTLGQLALKWP